MKIAVGADHAGFVLKNLLRPVIESLGHDVEDLGAHEYIATDDYPDYAFAVAREVAAGKADRGIVVCGSGIGAGIAANKVPGVRAGISGDTYSAHQGVEHDDMNVLVLGSRITGEALAEEIVKAFLNASFSNEERHVRRLNKVTELEMIR